VVDVLLKRESVRQAPTHYQYLVSGVAEVLARRGSPATNMPLTSGPDEVRLDPHDVELVRDVFWDLFRQGYVVLGGMILMNRSGSASSLKNTNES